MIYLHTLNKYTTYKIQLNHLPLKYLQTVEIQKDRQYHMITKSIASACCEVFLYEI